MARSLRPPPPSPQRPLPPPAFLYHGPIYSCCFLSMGGLTRGDSSSVSSSVKLHHGIMGDRRINPRSNYKSPTIFFRFFFVHICFVCFHGTKIKGKKGGAKYTPPKLNIDIKNDALEHVSPASNLALLDLTRQKSRALKESTLIIQIW